MRWPLGSYFCKHAGDHSVTTEACSPPHLTCLVCVVWRPESLMELSALWSHDSNPMVSRTQYPTDQHDDVIIWKHFPRYWPFVWAIGEFHWRGALKLLWICAWADSWANNPWNCSCHRIWRTPSSMEFHRTARVSKFTYSKFHGIPWNCSYQRNCRTRSSMEFHWFP